jgi:chemosensory pili system protein ChpB (putative protein-glutamate methylesterase)
MQDEDDAFLIVYWITRRAPILFGLDEAPSQGARSYPRWERRVFIKLMETVGEPVQKEPLDELEELTEASVQPVALPPELEAYHADGLEWFACWRPRWGGRQLSKSFWTPCRRGCR